VDALGDDAGISYLDVGSSRATDDSIGASHLRPVQSVRHCAQLLVKLGVDKEFTLWRRLANLLQPYRNRGSCQGQHFLQRPNDCSLFACLCIYKTQGLGS